MSPVDTIEAHSGDDPDPDHGADHETDDDQAAVAQHDDGTTEVDDSQAEDEDSQAEDEDSQAEDEDADAEDEDEPQVSRRDRTLAWLALESGVDLPASTARTAQAAPCPG